MTIILFDSPQSRQAFYPFTPTRPVCDLRQGILTLKEKWELKTGLRVAALTEPYLNLAFPTGDDYLYIDAGFYPTDLLTDALKELTTGSVLTSSGMVVAIKTRSRFSYPLDVVTSEWQVVEITGARRIEYPWQLFLGNDEAIRDDFNLITKGRASAAIHESNIVFGSEQVFLEPGVQVRACTINAEAGPVYIGKNAEIMEGSSLRGPIAICENAVVKMGAQLYGGTTIGPWCTAGGEIKNSIMMAYSNKGHHGYLGDAVIGEWCNLGAGTSNSNVKNTAGIVRMWNPLAGPDGIAVGKKAGLLMGDYSKSAINTSFNTGTVVGVCCNVFDNGFPSKHMPSFSWGNERYRLDKAMADIDRWKQMKGMSLDLNEKEIITRIYEN